MILQEAPVRLCCGQRHWTAECADGLVMCALCFDRVSKTNLMHDGFGRLWDCCQECGLIENLWICFIVMAGGVRR